MHRSFYPDLSTVRVLLTPRHQGITEAAGTILGLPQVGITHIHAGQALVGGSIFSAVRQTQWS